MTPRRRAMMKALGRSKTFLFKEGRGLRTDLDYYIYNGNGAGGTIDDDSIYLSGGNEYDGYILLARNIDWKAYTQTLSSYLSSESLDLTGYSRLCIEAKCYSGMARPHSIGIINESKNNTSDMLRENISTSRSIVHFSAIESFYDSTETRQVYSIDISKIDIGTIAIKCGNLSSMYAEIYNIWLE